MRFTRGFYVIFFFFTASFLCIYTLLPSSFVLWFCSPRPRHHSYRHLKYKYTRSAVKEMNFIQFLFSYTVYIFNCQTRFNNNIINYHLYRRRSYLYGQFNCIFLVKTILVCRLDVI